MRSARAFASFVLLVALPRKAWPSRSTMSAYIDPSLATSNGGSEKSA